MKVGIISDTHDLLRKDVLSSLKSVETILHAGDICSQKILDELTGIAPVHVVRGNADKEWAKDMPMSLDFFLDEAHVYMTHKKKDLPKDIGIYDLVVVGHSHRYSEARQGNAIVLNPGSCGPRRFYQPITLAVADIQGRSISITRVDLNAPLASAKIDVNNIYQVIEIVLKETKKGNGIGYIAKKYNIEESLTEQIVRLYVTHPGVTIDGIMTKMGL